MKKKYLFIFLLTIFCVNILILIIKKVIKTKGDDTMAAVEKNYAYIVKAKKDNKTLIPISKKQLAKYITAAEKYPFKK